MAATACAAPEAQEGSTATAPVIPVTWTPTPTLDPAPLATEPSPSAPAPSSAVQAPPTAVSPWGAIAAGPATAPETGAQASPTRMVIPSIGIDMPVSPQGVDGIGFMALPDQPSEAGWYEYGPAPGDAGGASVIAAHVDSKEFGIGPMVALRKLAPGELISVLDDSGAEHRYRVEAVRSVPLAELDLAELFDREGPPRLHVVTCGGDYIPERGGYQSNVIAYATLES